MPTAHIPASLASFLTGSPCLCIDPVLDCGTDARNKAQTAAPGNPAKAFCSVRCGMHDHCFRLTSGLEAVDLAKRLIGEAGNQRGNPKQHENRARPPPET